MEGDIPVAPINNDFKDKYHITLILFYVLGAICLLPGNFFPTANDYWMYKFRDPENEKSKDRTKLQAEFTSTFSIVANVCMFLFLIITVKYIRRKFGIKQRLLFSLIALIFFFIITVIFVNINTDSWQMGFFVMTMLVGSLLTGTGGIFMVTLFELGSKFPPNYFASILSGQSICGIASALAQIACLGLGGDSKITGLVYFLFGMMIVVISFIFLVFIKRNSPMFQYYLDKQIVDTEKFQVTREDIWAIIGKIKYIVAAVVLVQGCTIMVQPGLTAIVISVNEGNGNKWNDLYFVPVITFLLANTMEYIGRECAGVIKKPGNAYALLSLGIIRFAFIPLFMFCNARPRENLKVVFDQDWIYIVLIIIFNFTNGYLVNVSILQVSKVTKEEETSLALIFLSIFMMIILAICSFLNAPIVNAL